VNGWTVEVETDPDTGISSQVDVFTGREKMEMKQEQLYLRDLLAADGTHTKNVQLWRYKSNYANHALHIFRKILL
jgi:hypothetical protein